MLDPQPGELFLPDRTRGWRAALVGGTVLWLVVRTAGSAISLVVLWTHAGPSVSDRAGPAAPDNGGNGFFAVLHHWDSSYFLSISSGGYFPPNPAPGMTAFFPGYPLAARGMSELITLARRRMPAWRLQCGWSVLCHR